MMASSRWLEWRVTEAVASPPYPSPPHTPLRVRRNVRLVVEWLVLCHQLFLNGRKEKVENKVVVEEEGEG